MIKSPNRLILCSAIFCTAFSLQTAQADEVLLPVTVQDQPTIQLPEIDRDALIEQVMTLRSQLIQRKQALAESVAENKMDGSDAIISVIMPGGLLYASYKKARYEQAKNELERISADIEEFSGDLLAMQPAPAPVAVAQLP